MAIDPKAQQNVNDFQLYVTDTLISISAQFSEKMKEAVEDAFNGLDKTVISSVEKDLTKTFKNLVKLSDDIALNEFKIKQGLIGVKDLSKQQNSLDEKRLLLAAKINHAKALGAEFDEEDLIKAQEALELQQQSLDLAKEQTKQIEKRLGLTGRLVGSLNQIPGLGKFIKAGELETELRSAAANGAGQFKVMGLAISNSLKQIGKGLTDPLFLFTAQISLLKKFYNLYSGVNQRVVDQQRQLGLSYNTSEELYKSASRYAATQDDIFVNDVRILEGRKKLNDTLGTSLAFTDEVAKTAEKLSYFYGLSNEQNANLVTLGVIIGQNNNDILNTVIKTTNNQKQQFGGTINQQKVLQKISSISGEILTKFKGNIQALTSAVLQADRLGLNLEQVSKIGDSLLNFESSIENELKAELLTGKAINLEKARSAALSGDTIKLTKEIANQVGDIHKFEKMNVIQRKAYAEAFGMDVSEMGDMLRKREFENKLQLTGKETAAEQLRLAKERGLTLEDSVRKDLESASLAEAQKFTFEKIQSILTRISAGPMKTIFVYLEKGLNLVGGILNGFSKMTGGKLGDALGAAILGAPLLLGSAKLLIGTASSIFKNGLTSYTAPWVRVANFPAGGMGSQFAGGSFSSGKDILARRGKLLGRTGAGLAGVGVGLATSMVASNMEEGGAKDTVEVLGSTASGALTGFALGGPLGAAIGGLIGGVGSLVSVLSAKEEREKAQQAANDEANKKTNDLLESLAGRPIKLDIGTNTVAQWNVASNQYGTSGVFD